MAEFISMLMNPGSKRSKKEPRKLTTVALVWLGSNKSIATFDFDFYQSKAPRKLRKRAGEKMQAKRASVRLLFKDKDVACRPAALDANKLLADKAEVLQNWTGLMSELPTLSGVVTLHASRYSKANVFIGQLVSSDFLDPQAVSNPQVMLAALSVVDYNLFDKASPELKADRRFVVQACRINGLVLHYAHEWRSDRDVVLAACQRNGNALRYASDALRSDREVVLAVCQQDGYALRYADAALKADRDVVLAACRQNGNALQYADEQVRADLEVVLAACKQSKNALSYHKLRPADLKVVLATEWLELQSRGWAEI